MDRLRRLAPLAALALMVGPLSHAEPRTLADAVYTEEQADQGKRLFREHCRTCHDRRYFGPVLRAWQGESVAGFYDVMAATMPQSNPGSLSDEEYTDILAYILELNDFPAGADPLDHRGGAMAEVTIVSP